MAISWVRDLPEEKWAEARKIKFDRSVKVRIKDIDLDISLHNNARLGKAIDQDVVLSYALAMEGGASFPMAWLKPLPPKAAFKYAVLAGNHRLQAVQQVDGNDVIEAYVVAGGDEHQADLLARTSNRRTGWQQGKEEAVQHAQALMHKYNMSAKDAAAECGLPYNYLVNQIRAAEVCDILEARGLKPRELPKSVQLKLAKLKNNLNVLYTTCSLLLDPEIKSEISKEPRAKRVIDEMAESLTEADAAETAKTLKTQILEEMPKKGRGTGGVSRTRLFRALNLLKYAVESGGPRQTALKRLSQAQITTEEDVTRVKSLWRSCLLGMRELLEGSS